KDLNKSQSVADADLNKNQSVAGTDLNQSVTEKQAETLADGTDENKTVPYSEMKKAIDARTEAEEKLAKQEQDHATQMAILQANQQPVQSQTQPVPDYDQAKADLGLTNEAYIDEVQRSKIFVRMTELINVRSRQSAANFSNQQFEGSHSDFGSVVGLRNPVTNQVQPTAELLKIITEKPYLAAAASASSQGAYEIVIQQRELDKLQQQNIVQEEHLKQQGIDTKLAPVSGAAAAGGSMAAATGIVTVEQQREMEERVAAGEFNQKG
ncbi:hypothetical protein LCGC14_2987820, partial [marine sediment metagenome]